MASGNISIQSTSNQIAATGDNPKSLQVAIDFTNGTTFDLSLLLQQQQARIGAIQTIYVDLADTDDPLVITCSGTRQRITAKGRTQGYYNVLAPNPADFNFFTEAGILLTVNLMNVPIPGAVWPTQ